MSKRYYTSGQFARLCHTTKETLFHYDRLGLLSPSHKGVNGYRYYDVLQFLQFDMINLFKETGTPLKEIGSCLASAKKGNILAFLEEKEAQLYAEQRRLATRLALIRSMSSVVREVHSTVFDRLVLRHMPAACWEIYPQKIAGLDTEEGAIQAAALFMESFRKEDRSPVMPTGVLYQPEDFLAGRLGCAELISPADAETPEVQRRNYPAGCYALYAHQGTWPDQVDCWRRLPGLLARHDLRLAGAVFVLEMGSYVVTGNSKEYVIHCRMPVDVKLSSYGNE